MTFAMMLFFVWGEDMKISSINTETAALMGRFLHLQNAAWEATRMSGSSYFRSQLSS
jgi:hypothetical protein